MANFEKAYKLVMGYEGGYSNDPDDVGGETYKGVARKYYPDWEGWDVIDQAKHSSNFPHNLDHIEGLDLQVQKFYKTHYWNRFGGDSMPDQSIANELFDIAVNMGVGRAVKFLQISLNVLNRNQLLYMDLVEDCIYGPNTERALNTYLLSDDPSLLVKVLNVLQGYHYIKYCKQSPAQEKFMRGWFKRVTLTK